ncbi:hypothetical protein DF034_09470 [Burkholderia anthina]|nr:hypothetical protein DF034_09470 [Burkholderia anthina]
MNQGKKSFARRSAPLKTQNRRVLRGTCSTICGAIRRTPRSRPMGAAPPRPARLPVRPFGRRHCRRVFIVAAFPQHEWSDRPAAPARSARSCAPIARVCVDRAAAPAGAGKQANRPIRAATALAE